MSRFDDLDQYLQREAAAKKEQEQERIRKLLEARTPFIPQIMRAYDVVGEYYRTLLQPRGYRVIHRKKEGPTPNELLHLHERTPLYAYVVNVLSSLDQQPYANDSDYSPIWRDPHIGEGDYHVWHPNVALHVANLLTPARSNSDDVKLSIELKAWGRISTNETELAPQGIRLYTADAGWNHVATSVYIDPREPVIEEQVETGLRILTPNIVNHKEAFRKQFS